MVFSGATALYIGNQSFSKAYVGETLVWPKTHPATSYTLEKISVLSNLSYGDKYVLISNKILGGRVYFDTWYNLNFPGFDGSGTYSAIPSDTLVLTYENRSGDKSLYTYSGYTKYTLSVYANDYNNMYLTRDSGYSLKLNERNGGVAVLGDSTSTSGGFSAYLSSIGDVPTCRRNNENYIYYLYKLTIHQ